MKRAVAYAACFYFDALFRNFDAGHAAEPGRRSQYVGFVLRSNFSAVSIGPLKQIELTLSHLLLHELGDRGVFPHQRLVGNQWRDKA